MDNKVELERRVEIKPQSFKSYIQLFKKNYDLLSHTSRLSYMGFTITKDSSTDLRSRITNGESEVVLKLGKLHAKDRVEITQKIGKDELVGFAKIFSHLSSRNFIAERETYNFNTKEGVVISVVKSAHISYIEFEILCDPKEVKANDKIIKELVSKLGLRVLTDKEFNSLNSRLEAKDDWKFCDNPKNIDKLVELLKKY